MSVRQNEDYYWGRDGRKRHRGDEGCCRCNASCMKCSNRGSCRCNCCCKGPKGERGPTGPTGLQGLRGPTGPTGLQGLRGATGPSGLQGLKGATGSTGLQGLRGPTGEKGLQGPTGPTGPNIKAMGIQAEAHNSKGTLIKNGENIILDTIISDSKMGITYDVKTGNATFSVKGNYAVIWWAIIGGAVGVRNVKIGIHSIPASPVEYITSMIPTTTGQICGQAILSVTQTPTTAALVNISGNDIQLSDMDTQVSLMIIYLGGETV